MPAKSSKDSSKEEVVKETVETPTRTTPKYSVETTPDESSDTFKTTVTDTKETEVKPQLTNSDTSETPTVQSAVIPQKEDDKKTEDKSSVASFSLLDADKSTDTSEKKPSFLDTPSGETKAEDTEERSDQISSDEVKKWLKDVRPNTNVEVEKGRGGNVKKIIIILSVLILLGGAVGAFFYFKSNNSSLNDSTSSGGVEIAPTETIEPTEALSPTPEAVDLSLYNVSVLNGTGVAGEAAKVKTELEELEFAKITAGNATKKDYNSTTIQMKKQVPDAVFDQIREILMDTYAVVKADEPLEDDSSFDIVITVGVRKS